MHSDIFLAPRVSRVPCTACGLLAFALGAGGQIVSPTSAASPVLPGRYAPATEALGVAGTLPARQESASFASNPASLIADGLRDDDETAEYRLYASQGRLNSDDPAFDQIAQAYPGQMSFVQRRPMLSFGLSWRRSHYLEAAGRWYGRAQTTSLYHTEEISIGVAKPVSETQSIGVSLDWISLNVDGGTDDYAGERGYSIGWQWLPTTGSASLGQQVFAWSFASGAGYQNEVLVTSKGPDLRLVERTLSARPASLRVGIEPGIAWLGSWFNVRLRVPAEAEARRYTSLHGVYADQPLLALLNIRRYSLGTEASFSRNAGDFSWQLRAGAALEIPDDPGLPDTRIMAAGLGLVKGLHTFALGAQTDDNEQRHIELAYQYGL